MSYSVVRDNRMLANIRITVYKTQVQQFIFRFPDLPRLLYNFKVEKPNAVCYNEVSKS